MEGKTSMQKAAPEKIFELEEQRTKKALMVKWEGERERARMLQAMELSGAVRNFPRALDSSSLDSCSSSLGHDTDEAMSEPSWTALAKGTERYWWSVDLEGEMGKLES